MTEKVVPPNARELFRARLKNLLFVKEDVMQVMHAYDIAESAHANQLRLSGEPYFEHPLAAANILLNQCQVKDASVICGALLHDVAEDTKYFDPNPKSLGYREYIEKVKQKLAEDGFSDKTAEIVISLTKPQIIEEPAGVLVLEDGVFVIKTEKVFGDGIDFFDRDQAYVKKMELLDDASPEALLVKMADRLHNLRTFYPKVGRENPTEKIEETKTMKNVFNKVDEAYPVEYAILSVAIDEAIEKLESRYKR
jgi:(p)ppGpp synthase/HD superfamily hydrolase